MEPWPVICPSDTSLRTVNPIRRIVEGLRNSTKTQTKAHIALSLGDPTTFGNFPPPTVLIDKVVEGLRYAEWTRSAPTEACDAILAVKSHRFAGVCTTIVFYFRSGKHNGYIHSAGTLEARKAVAAWCSSRTSALSAEDVVITSGCSGALDLAISVLANPGVLFWYWGTPAAAAEKTYESDWHRRCSAPSGILLLLLYSLFRSLGDNMLIPQPAFALYQTLAESKGIEIRRYRLLPDQDWQADLAHMSSLVDERYGSALLSYR